MALQTNALSTTNPYGSEIPTQNNTIDANVKRIGYYHWAIKNKLKALGVKVPASAGDNTSTSARDFVDTDHINTTYAALNAIALQNAGDQTVSVGGSYTVPVGYVSTSYKVKGPTLSGNATAADVLKDKTFYSNSGTKQTGEMTNNGAVSASVGLNSSYTIPAGYHNGSGTVAGPVVNTYTGKQTITLDITKATVDGNDSYVCTSGVLPTGYYDNATITYNVSEAIDSSTERVFNIYDAPSTSVTLNSKTGTISVPANYDFQTARKYSVKAGSLGSVSNEITGTLTYTPTITKNAAGNVSASAAVTTKPSSGYYVAVSSAANTGTITATASHTGISEGWIDAKDNYTAGATATVGAGASPITYLPITGAQSSFNSSSTSGKNYTSKELSNKTMYVDITEGYIPDTRWTITAKNGSASVNSADFSTAGKVTVSGTATAGWVASVAPKTFPLPAYTRKGTGTYSNDYYTVGTGGYIAAGSYVGTKLSANTSYDPVTADSDLTIDPGTILTGGFTVNKISVGAGSINSATLGEMTSAVAYTTSNDNAEGTETYMNKFTVDPTGIIAALQEI